MTAHEFLPRDALASPRFGQIPTFMRLPHTRALDRVDTVLVGIPYDGGTSYRPGARFGPREVRAQSCFIRPYNPAVDIAPFAARRVADYGDIDDARWDVVELLYFSRGAGRGAMCRALGTGRFPSPTCLAANG